MMRTARITIRRFIEALISVPSIDSSTACCMGVIALGIVGWITALIMMRGMDQGPGTPLHNFPTFLMGWIIMLTAMMLPSEMIYVKVYTTILKGKITLQQGKSGLAIPLICFLAGYGIAWILYGTLAFILDALIRMSAFEFINWNQEGPRIAGSILFLAGLYQVSSLKYACLTHCRSPFSFFAHHWRIGILGSLQMGVLHGLICVACCWALMAVMFAVGAMNLAWMGVLTLLMFAEKIVPFGQKLTLPIAIFLWVMGGWIAVTPGSAPFLKNPLLLDTSNHVDLFKQHSEESFKHPLLGQPAPEFILPNVRQQEVSLSELNKRGPVVIVFYYGYYCSHCVAQLFGLNERLQNINELQATVVAISADTPQQTKIKFAKYGGFDFPVLSDRENRIATKYKIYQPATASRVEDQQHGLFVVDQNGQVVWAYHGETPFMDHQTLLEVLKSLDQAQ